MKINTAGNGVFYYDFETERSLENWQITKGDGGLYALETSFDVASADRYTLVFHYSDAELREMEIDGRFVPFNWEKSEIAYITERSSVSGLTYAFKADLEAGLHKIRLNLTTAEEDVLTTFRVALLSEPPCSAPETSGHVIKAGVRKIEEGGNTPPDYEQFRPGVGTSPCAGRFGFSKGDGVLDCGMPLLGVVDKLYPCGHPDYKKPYKWTFSVLPPGIDPSEMYHGSVEPAQVGIEGDEISINHLSASWKTSFKSIESFFEREAGGEIDFSCTYSLGSPGILVESSDPGISLSMLEAAGNYRYILIPREEGIECGALNEGFVFDGKMSENWMLIFGATEFPDIPVLLVFQKAPSEIRVKRAVNGRLQSVDFHIPSGDAKMFVATPFGIESFYPKAPDDESFLQDAADRCRFWSRAFLAYPVGSEEFFRLDEENERVEVAQKFEYRMLEDEWHTEPLLTAPVPPPLTILEGTGIVEFDADIADFKFPTKYGLLKGGVGRNYSSYKIPFMPCERRFPLKDRGDAGISDLLKDGLKEYFEFHEKFDVDRQAYPYAGSALEPYSWAAPLFNFMAEPDRARLSAKLSERMAHACDPDFRYRYPIIKHGYMMSEMPDTDRVLEIYSDPDMRYIELYNGYYRKEPFTGAEYQLCYLNLGLFSGGTITKGSREEVAGLKIPLIENDWGVGLTFYYIYLGALASGDFNEIRKNWKSIRNIYGYFEVLHDWVCMSTGVCDNGRGWVEGANYGAFTSMINMAQAVGDSELYAKSIYMGAKQLMLRLAMCKSGESYFCRYFNSGPWYVTKSFREEDVFSNGFLHVPFLRDGKQFTGIYNMTTEGIYPELFNALLKFLPAEWKKTRELAISALMCDVDHYCKNKGTIQWGKMQGIASCLIAAALDDKFDKQELLRDISEAEKNELLVKEWRGIHIFSRLLPKNYFKAQLLAWLAGREHPVWLEYWTDVEVLRADYDAGKQTAVLEFKTRAPDAEIRFGARRTPSEIRLNGELLKGWSFSKNRLTVPVPESGTLEVLFDPESGS